MKKTGNQRKASKSRAGMSVELAKALIRCAGTGICIVQDGTFRYVNSLFREMTGYTAKELLGIYPLDLGTNSYIQKPVDAARFAEVIMTLCSYWLVLNEPPPLSDKKL